MSTELNIIRHYRPMIDSEPNVYRDDWVVRRNESPSDLQRIGVTLSDRQWPDQHRREPSVFVVRWFYADHTEDRCERANELMVFAEPRDVARVLAQVPRRDRASCGAFVRRHLRQLCA
jgi:hypothetical protein